ncbi:MAG TPA: choline-sulfatase, partial [Gaiellales bacterium]|nr:choline-sulfatase [Gaiellales bacterium]
VMADQLAAGVLPAHGGRACTPVLDGLAAGGCVFESAYCASPLCAPSRASLLTGLLPSETGVFDNAAPLAPDVPTVTHALRAAGYRTALAGKMHFVGPDQLHGFEERLTTDVYPAGFDWTPDWTLGPDERPDWYHNMQSLRDAGVRDAAMQTDYDDEVSFRAARYLRDLRRGDERRPFFLTVSFTAPHDPWEVRRRHWDLYQSVDIGAPAVPAIARPDADPHSLRLRDAYLADREPLTANEADAARRAYLASVSEVDERTGALLEVLAANGMDERTIVVFTSDHGEMLGERGLWYKMSFFEGSARVPLIVRGPGIEARRVPAPVSQLDLAVTLAEIADADPRGLGGSGLGGVLGGGEEPDRPVFAEYLAEAVPAPAFMIRRGRFKYVACGDDPEQLYDLDADPLERENLAAAAGRAETLEEFRRAAGARWDAGAITARVLESQRKRRLVSTALATGAHTPWDHQPASDASREFVRGGAASTRPEDLRPGGGLPG